VYDTETGQREQITGFSEYDVKWPSIGPGPNGEGEIVFQNGSELYLLDLGTRTSRALEVTIPGDRPTLLPQRIDASDFIQASDVSSTGKRVVLEARGDIWTLPAKKGIPRNLTRTSGVAERDPIWSPDGRWIAYLSDADGEYDLYVTQSDGKGETRKVAELGPGYRYLRGWSPDSKYVSLAQKSGAIHLVDVDTGELTLVDTDPAGREPGVSWSHDSRWITYALTGENDQSAVWLYEVESGEKHRVTSGFFRDSWPTFDRKGKWLFFTSNRSFGSPIYEDIGSTFVYTGTGVLIAVPLREDVEYPWPEKNDEEEWEEDEAEEEDEKDDEDEDEGDDEEDQDEEGEKEDDEDDEQEPDDAAADDGISGTWEGMLSGAENLPPEGLPFSLYLGVDAEGAVSGTMSGGPYQGVITGGTYDRGSGTLKFTLEVETDEGVQPFAVEATVSGESMSGTVTGEGFFASFTATRTSTEVPEEEEEEEEEAVEAVEIDIEGFEARAIQLPVGRGSYGWLAVNDKNQLIYASRGIRGSGEAPAIKLFDMEDDDKKEKTVVSGAGAFSMTADGKRLLVYMGRSYAIVDAKPGQKTDKRVPLQGMTAVIVPREEWRQVLRDAWRIYRDFFYVENMHGVDWPAVLEQYSAMLDDCVSREDVAYVIREMISELNVGHAYYRGRSTDSGPSVSVGLLGVDFELHEGAYRFAKIHAGGAWDVDARGPLAGTDIKEGEYLLAVDGVPLDTSKDPWAAFQGLANQVTTLTVSEKPVMDDDAREVNVKPIGREYGLRYRSWVEANRRYVEEKTDGRVGYIHVPDTGRNGQNNLFRQFYGQRHKGALIIDERWNHGGQIPSRFIELLNRPLLNYWAVRDGRDGRTPPDAHFGPKCMLINESAGSGGDMFPALFRQVGLGKLIGNRTWGGLVGISGNPRLIDGQSVSVPTFGYYQKDGTWGIEGHGVDPDIEVIDDPALMVDGGDPQLDAAIAHILEELERNPYVPAERPPDPVRTGVGIAEEDK
jgi:C-terminal processing protease CtpA/Prc